MADRDHKRAKRNRELIATYKVAVGCVDCGYNVNSVALEFDHRFNDGKPFSGKQRSIASMMYSSLDKIFEEIEQCDVVCANCHSIRTFSRRKHGA